MQFIDTHIHLQDYKQKCATDIIAQALAAGVTKMVCVSVVEKDWEYIADLTRKFPQNIIPAFGLHPWFLSEAKEGWQDRLEQYVQKFPEALIGETGLDKLKNEHPEPQNQIFRIHIDLAKKYSRPLIVHAVKAQVWLEKYWDIMPKKFVLHSYGGKKELLKQALKAGGYISFSPSILQRKDTKDLFQQLPLKRILLETDGPFHGNEDISSNYIPELAEKMAERLSMEQTNFTEQIYKNSLEFIKSW